MTEKKGSPPSFDHKYFMARFTCSFELNEKFSEIKGEK